MPRRDQCICCDLFILAGQSAWLVNYAERHRAGLRVGTAIIEGTANFLVNRRMNKQMPLALRAAAYERRSRVTTIAKAGVSALIVAHSPSASPTFKR